VLIMRMAAQRHDLSLMFCNPAIFIFWTAFIRAMLFALIWLVLTGGVINSWLIGVPAVLLSTLVSITLLPPIPWSFIGLIRIIPFFLWRSLCAAIDVAKRVLHPQLPISPDLYHYQWHLSSGVPQIFMANIVSLLPGTLSVELHDKYLCIHVLDQTGDFISQLSIVESYVARILSENVDFLHNQAKIGKKAELAHSK